MTPDKRAKNRYTIELDLEYKLLDKGRVQLRGIGRTVNISSDGVLFETGQPVPSGRLVELKIKWPILLQGVCGMNLVVHGRIIRCQANDKVIAVRMESHEFRTAGFRVSSDEIKRMHKAVASATGRAACFGDLPETDLCAGVLS